MAQIESWFGQDLSNAVKVQYITGNVFSMDNLGNRVGVYVYKDGAPYSLAGTISGNIIRADGGTVAVTGSLSENRAWIDLPQSCYTVPGRISIVIKNTADSVVTTLCAVVANVYQSSTDTVIDPGTIIPSIEALIAEIETAVASIPADYSALTDVASDGATNIKGKVSIATTNSAINTSGVVIQNSAYLRSDYIELKKGWRLNYTNLNGGASFNLVSFYTSTSESDYTEGIAGEGASHPKTGVYIPSVDGFVRLCTRAAEFQYVSVSIESPLVYDVAQLNTKADKTKMLSILLPKILQYGLEDFAGNVDSLNNANNTNTDLVYVSTTVSNRLMYHNGTNWVYADTLTKSDLFSSDTYASKSEYSTLRTLLQRMLTYGYEVHLGGIASMPGDTSVDTRKIYIAYTANASSNGRVMYYNGTEWKYIVGVTKEDLLRLADIANVKFPVLGESFRNNLITVLGYNEASNYVNIGFVTDTHSNVQDASVAFETMKKLNNCKIGTLVHCGDIITSTDLTKQQFIDAVTESATPYKSFNDIMFAKGNHDNNHDGEDPTQNINNPQFRTLMLTGIKDAVFNANDPGSCYYYRNYDCEKLRVIVLDSFADYTSESVSFGSTQINWLYSTALNVSDGWTVVIFSHMTVSGTSIINVLKAFNERGTQYGDYLFPNTITTHFAGIIHGHKHDDRSSTDNGFNEIGVACGYRSNNGVGAVDVFTFDTTTKHIYETRFAGTGESRSFTFD